MKEEYEDLEMEIIEFDDEDVITQGPTYNPNETPITNGS